MSNSLQKLFYDENGVKYRNPERACSRCFRFPCEVEKLEIDFAKYGCAYYFQK